MSKLLALTLAVLACLLGGAATAHAQKPGFDQAWQSGVDAFNLNKLDEARRLFEQAAMIDPKSAGPHRYLANIAKAQGRWHDCVSSAVESMRLLPTQKNAPQVRADLDHCRQKLTWPELSAPLAQGQGGLAVRSEPGGVQVTVDGSKKGSTPMPAMPLTAGKRVVRLEAVGKLPRELEIDIVPTIVVDLDADLDADPDYVPPKDPGTDGGVDKITIGWILLTIDGPKDRVVLLDGAAPKYADDGTIESTPGEHILEVRADGYESQTLVVRFARAQKRPLAITLRSLAGIRRAKTAAWLSFGAAAAAGVAGFYFTQQGAEQAELASDYQRIERERPRGVTIAPSVPEGTLHSHAEIDDLRAEAKRFNTLSLVSFSVAAVAVGVSIYYFVQARPTQEAPRGKRAASGRLLPGLATGEGGTGATLSWSQEIDW